MNEWISVSDRLPEELEHVLAWNGDSIEKCFVMRFENGKPIWTYYDWMEWDNVSYWMPMPPPPSL